MAWETIRVPRTSQPQDACGIDWNNPIARGLILATAEKSPNIVTKNLLLEYGAGIYSAGANGVGFDNTSGGTNARYATGLGDFSQFDGYTAISVGTIVPSPYFSGYFAKCAGLSGANAIQWCYLNTSQIFVEHGSQGAFFSIPDGATLGNKVIAFLWDKASSSVRLYAQGSLAVSGNLSAVPGAGNAEFRIGANRDPSPNCLSAVFDGFFFWSRALSDAEIKSISDNPWQIFESEELTIWVPDAVGVGGAATVIPIGVQANSAIGTPAAIGAAIAALTGVSATGSVGSPTATGGASIPATASPSGVSASSAVGTPAAKGAAKALPAGVQATSAVGTPLVIGGSSIPATVLPAGVAGLAYVGSPVATGQARAYPLGVQATGAVGSPVVTAGGSAVAQPQGVAASSSVGAPVARGAAVAYPLGLAGYWSVGTPVAFEASDATPSIHRAISPAQSYTATSPAQSYTAVVPAQIYST